MSRIIRSIGLPVLAALFAAPLFAQSSVPVQPLNPQPAAATDEEASSLDAIEVTGSRIKKTDLEGQTPVFTLSRKDIDQSGLGSIGEVLQELTSGGKALNGKFNSSGNFGFPADGGGIGAGSAQVDLRHLESKRVLVLVDGLRWVNESSASGIGGSVDLNTIPLAIVERIDVLEDGASAIYGSDAIAGVINIITRRSYEGAELNAYYGAYDQGDGQTGSLDATWGRTGRGFNYVLSASYYDQRRISAADRKQSLFPVPGTGVTRGSSGTPQGRFIFCDPNQTPGCAPENFLSLALDNGTGTPVYDPASPSAPPSTYHVFTNADRFNFAPFNLVLTPNERHSLFGSARYDLTDSLRLNVKALYNRRQSINQAAPEPIFIGGDAGTGGLADTISIPANQPFNPFGFDLIAGDNFSLIGRRPLEGGPRIFMQDVDTTYLSAGLQGELELGGQLYDWDFNLVTSESDADQMFFNGYNVRRIQQALGDPADCAAIAGCVPLNIFGGQGADGRGTITQEMLGWIRINTRDRSDNKLNLASLNVSGDLFSLPAGPVAFATGYEFRKYEGSYDPDPTRIAGESQDSSAIPTAGEYDVNELYAELNLPVLANLPLAKRLDVSAALRFSDYSTFGAETTGKLGFRWQVVDELVARGTYAEGFRAPFIGELFGLAQFGASITDPCSNAVNDADGNDSTPTETACRQLGVPNGYEQINTQIITNTGGNPNLEPESTDSYTFGLVYSPEWALQLLNSRRFDLELTHYSHDIQDAIRAPDAQARLNACVQSGDANSVFCQGISRTETGQINRFSNLLANIGRFETSGWDFKLNWAGPDLPYGRFSAALQATHVADYRVTDALGTDFPQREGVEVNDSAIPEWQSNLQVDWAFNVFSAGWTVRYIDAVEESCSDFLDNTPNSFANLGLCSNPNAADNALSVNKLGSTVYHDLQFGWEAPGGIQNLRFSAGIQNLFDKQPPTCLSCSLNGYDAGTYDAPGQFGYIQANYRF